MNDDLERAMRARYEGEQAREREARERRAWDEHAAMVRARRNRWHRGPLGIRHTGSRERCGICSGICS